MAAAHTPTVSEVLAEYRRANGLDPTPTVAESWTFRIGPVAIRLPNFGWRREAITCHDLHHILTGFSCDMRGEFQMAAWEFAAGRFPHPAATLMCLPLVAAGVLWSPRSIWFAFRRGRTARSLYGTKLTETMLGSPLAALCAERASERRPLTSDIAAFILLLVKVGLIVYAPPAAIAIIGERLLYW